jgi:hypothetical protein
VNGARVRGTLVRQDVLGHLCRRICLLDGGICMLGCGLVDRWDCLWHCVTSRGYGYAFATGMVLMAAE